MEDAPGSGRPIAPAHAHPPLLPLHSVSSGPLFSISSAQQSSFWTPIGLVPGSKIIWRQAQISGLCCVPHIIQIQGRIDVPDGTTPIPGIENQFRLPSGSEEHTSEL